MAPNPELSYLDRVVMEIIETERTYVRDLRSIVEDYLAHIIDTADLPILPEQVCALFGNIEDIYEFNSELLQDLDQCENDPVEIARCFVLKSEYFEIYTQYCTNYPNSVAALTECMRNKTLLQFFMKRQEVLKHPLPLGSYLLKPVQRILKYHLLLQEIAKHFDADGAGYDVVEEAINTMTEVAWYINSMKRKHEHAVRLQEVQSLLINWPGPDLTTYGELVLEGTFRFHHAKNDRTLFLFDRLLLITKRRGENYFYKTHIACSMLMLMEGMKDSLIFSVTHYKNPKHPHTVQAKTIEEKKLWTHHIKRLILENHHTVIPQKAKDAILEMDSVSPKSRFHAERKKKAQSDDFTHIRHLDVTKLKNSKSLLKQEEESPNLQQLHEQQERHQISLQGPVEESQIQMSRTDLRSAEELKQESEAGAAQTRDQLYTAEEEEKHNSQVKQDGAANPTQDVQSSEEEEEEEEEERRGSANHSILPSSVLDKASAIAEHFISNVRRNSAVPEELRSPRRVQDGTLNLNGPDLSSLSEREEAVAESDRRLSRRRDSTLSKQERLIIAKIRCYYENAEQEDVGFGLKRRESLTYIPNGLVSTSISRFNKPPHSPRPTSTLPAPGHAPSVSSTASQSHVPDQDPFSSCVDGSVDQRPEDHQEESFRPSSEIIKVWQEMEKEVVRSPRRNRFRGSGSAFLQHSKSEPEEPGAENLSTITEESPAKVPAADEKYSSESSVFHLARKFSQHTHNGEPANQQRRRSSDTTITFNHNHLSPLREEPNHNIKGRLTSTSRVLSPGPSSSSPLPLPPYESFHWPDVRELRSRYSQLEAASHTLGSSTHVRFERAGSLDQKLAVLSCSDVSSKKSQSHYYITAQLPLPNNRTITVLENQPSSPTLVPSPTALRNITLPSISERCRAYEDLDEASVRAGPKLRTNHNKENKSADGVQQGVVRNLRDKFSSLR